MVEGRIALCGEWKIGVGEGGMDGEEIGLKVKLINSIKDVTNTTSGTPSSR